MKSVSIMIGVGLTGIAISFASPTFASTGAEMGNLHAIATFDRRGEAQPRDDRGGTKPRPRPADRPGDDRVDNGSSITIAAKGRSHPEDNGVDQPDACDDNGVDGACFVTRKS